MHRIKRIMGTASRIDKMHDCVGTTPLFISLNAEERLQVAWYLLHWRAILRVRLGLGALYLRGGLHQC